MAQFDRNADDTVAVADEAFANPVELRFDQGDTGIPNRSRLDIEAGTPVTVVNVTPGAVNSIALLWKPPEDDTAELVASGDDWIITPKAGTSGSYRIALTVDGLTVIHTFTTLTPGFGLHIPAANEDAAPDATLANWTGAKIEESETNEALLPGGKRSAFGWWKAFEKLLRFIDSLDIFGRANFVERHIYVSESTGDDDSGDGSQANPYADLPRAMADIEVNNPFPQVIHFDAGTYTMAPPPSYCRGAIIFYADEDWDSGVFVTDASGTADAGTDHEGITDAGLAANAFVDLYLECAGSRRVVTKNTTTRITPSNPFSDVGSGTPTTGSAYRIFHSAVNITSYNQTDRMETYARNCGGRSGFRVLEENKPLIAFVGVNLIHDHQFTYNSSQLFDDCVVLAYGFYMENAGFWDPSNSSTRVHATTLSCAYLDTVITDLLGVDANAWEGWGMVVNGIIELSGGAELRGYYSLTALLRLDGPSYAHWRGGNIASVLVKQGGVLDGISPQPNAKPILGRAGWDSTAVYMIGGEATLTSAELATLGGPLLQLRSSARMRILNLVSGEASGSITLDVQGASSVSFDGTVNLGKAAGDDLRCGTLTANKSTLSAANTGTMTSHGSTIVRQP